MKATQEQKQIWINQIKESLGTYYNVPACKRNQWRFNERLRTAIELIEKGEEVKFKGAQWGGKWGNYYRMIALNSQGSYQFVTGFHPERELD